MVSNLIAINGIKLDKHDAFDALPAALDVSLLTTVPL